MSGFAVNRNIKEIRRSIGRPLDDPNGPGIPFRRTMKTCQHIGMAFLIELCGHGIQCSIQSFFSRLENKEHIPIQFFTNFRKAFGRIHQHSLVDIMAAGMHDPFIFRSKGQPRLFHNGQRIDILPQAYSFPRVSSL